MKITSNVIEELFSRKECEVLKSSQHEWNSGNSTVSSTPPVDLAGIFGSSHIEVGASVVRIVGESGEPLHFHSSHLVGLVVRGSGWLCRPNEQDGGISRRATARGDVVIIPRGALHLFECDRDGELEYIALEFSDGPIDYQKHWLVGLGSDLT